MGPICEVHGESHITSDKQMLAIALLVRLYYSNSKIYIFTVIPTKSLLCILARSLIAHYCVKFVSVKISFHLINVYSLLFVVITLVLKCFVVGSGWRSSSKR